MDSYTVEKISRGYHFHKGIWETAIGLITKVQKVKCLLLACVISILLESHLLSTS